MVPADLAVHVAGELPQGNDAPRVREERSSVVELETSAFLNKGDFVEVFTFQDGQEGRIALLPEGSLWVAEAW